MILTLYYMYATFMQWWRLGALKQKLSGTIGPQNALLLTSAAIVADSRSKKCVENLLFEKEGRVACTIVPRQKLSLNQWALFPRDPRCFPIHIGAARSSLQGPKIYLLFQAHLDAYTPYQYERIKLEQYGEPVAWRVAEQFEVILKTDLIGLTKLMNSFSYADMSINHDLRLVAVELVDVEGQPSKIKYDRKFSTYQQLNYSRTPPNWKRFATTVKHIYAKLSEAANPKIMIENGTKTEDKKVPISEVKPIKKSAPSTSKNTLEVHTARQHRKRDSSNSSGGDVNKNAANSEATSKEKDVVTTKVAEQPIVKVELTAEAGCIKKEHKKEHHKAEQHKSDKKDTKGDKKDTKDPKSDKKDSKSDSKDPKIDKKDSKADKKDLKNDRNDLKTDKKDPKTDKKDSKTDKKDSKTDKKVLKSDSKDLKSDSKDPKTDKKDPKTDKKDSKADKKDPKTDKKEPKVDKKDPKADKKSKDHKAKQEIDKNKLSVSKPSKRHETDSKKTYSEAAQTSGSSAKNLQRQNATSSKETSPNRVVKPPNILVYADSVVAKENVKSVLKNIINKEKYTIYDLPVNTSSSFWDSSTTLVIICGNVPPNLTPHLIQYWVTGGQLLCLCSDLLYSILEPFSTAEVREHELVRFSYGDWKRVKMMHHIFCYQASPAKKQFSKDSDQSSHSSNGSSPVAPRTPNVVNMQHNGQTYTIQVQVLGAEETWQTPSLLLASIKDLPGRAVFSQVHLEVDPSQYQEDENKYTALKDSDKARLEIMKHILCTHLDIDCKSFNQNVTYKPAYFLGRHDLKLDFLNNCKDVKDNKLAINGLELEFCGKGVEPGNATATRLPVMILSCPTNFSTVEYYETLQTDAIGRLVIYADTLTSTQDLLKKTLTHGLAIIARQQTSGRGRSSNEWISPEGCAMFSLQIHVPLKSPLGEALPLMQHLVMVAVIAAVKSIPGLESIDIGLKWPNDLYAFSSIKIGGLIANTTIEGDQAVVNVGCGVNLNNLEPTLCLNEVIARHCTEHKIHVDPLHPEKYFASVFNEAEGIFGIVQGGDLKYLFELYYKYWLHANAKITVSTNEGESRDVTVTGIDDCGFLLVQSPDGIVSSVQPDGNSFDMLKGLIAPKIS